MIKAAMIYQPFASLIIKGYINSFIIDRKEDNPGTIMIAAGECPFDYKEMLTLRGVGLIGRMVNSIKLTGMHPKTLFPVGKFIGAVEIQEIIHGVDTEIWLNASERNYTVFTGKIVRFREPILCNHGCGFYKAKITKTIMLPVDYENFQESFKIFPESEKVIQLSKSLSHTQKKTYRKRLQKRRLENDNRGKLSNRSGCKITRKRGNRRKGSNKTGSTTGRGKPDSNMQRCDSGGGSNNLPGTDNK